MRILLVNPPRYLDRIPVIREDRCEITDRYAIIPPYSLLCIASILREEGHEVDLVDANGTSISYEELEETIGFENYDALIFRFTPTTFSWDMRIAQKAKFHSNRIITIGICLTLHTLGEQVLKMASSMDYYLPLNWEEAVPQLMEFIGNGEGSEIQGVYYRRDGDIEYKPMHDSKRDFDVLPLPAYDLLPSLEYYRPNAPTTGNFMILYTSKGCPFSCSYCTVANTAFKMKSTGKIVEELSVLYEDYNVRLVSFFDETFTLKKSRVIELCDQIKKKMPGLRWYCNTRVNLVDEEMLQAMREGGCRGISFGVESGSQRILDGVRKGITVDEAAKAIAMAKKSGLKVYTSFIFGLPGENHDSVKETMDFVKTTLPHGAQFNIAVPYPGTNLYEYAKKKNLISEDVKWDELLQHKAVMRTEVLSAEELENIRKAAYKGLYLNKKWIIQNLGWVLRHPEDIPLGIKYYFKSLKNLILYNMEHAH